MVGKVSTVSVRYGLTSRQKTREVFYCGFTTCKWSRTNLRETGFMGAYIVKRLLQVIPVIIIVTLSVFLMLTLTGDPVRALIGPGETLDEEQIESLRREMGLDRPIFEQYVTWMGKIIQGDFGRSRRAAGPG